MHAGPEIAVASTKAFTNTLVCFALLALHLGRVRDLSPPTAAGSSPPSAPSPTRLARFSPISTRRGRVAARISQHRDAFFIGRASAYPVALEGAQKLKEISYIHAEAYPASELKHGPLALRSHRRRRPSPCFPRGDLYEKTLCSLEEIRARRGPVVAVTHPGDARLRERVDDASSRFPPTEPALDPIL